MPAETNNASAPHRRVRLVYLVSHPIQYQAPLLRRIAREPGIDLTVLFASDLSVRGYRDEGFGVEVTWDTPLLEGYRSRFLPRLRDNGTITAANPICRGIFRALRDTGGAPAFDALWVHGYASVNSLAGILAANALGIPVLLRAESWLSDRPRSPLTLTAKRLFFTALRRGVSAVLPIGTRNALYWHEYLGEDVPQFPMPYAVDNAFFAARAASAQREQQQEQQREQLRERLRLPAGRPIILFASKLQPRKQADHLLEAYCLLAQRWPAAQLPCLVLAGDGSERSRLEEFARTHGLADVRFPGFFNQSELPALFDLADVFVLPSRHEPWGLVVNEAMSTGCPVVLSSDVGCHPDLVTNGIEGFVYQNGDIPALADALDRVLASPETARAMGEAARRRIASWNFEADLRGLRAALAAVTRKFPA
jgi:glycosyltransferase involved in cell wall biosynthesis